MCVTLCIARGRDLHTHESNSREPYGQILVSMFVFFFLFFFPHNIFLQVRCNYNLAQNAVLHCL